MPSLGQLLSAHAPILWLDAASARAQVGWFPTGDPLAAKWAAIDDEAGVGLFRGLEQLAVDVGQAAAFVFCDGPGSTLGVRTSAMALRTWQVLANRPIYAYHSLAVVAAAEGRDDVTVIADARRGYWHALKLGGPLQRALPETLAGRLITPRHFRHWSPLPPGTVETSYDLRELLPLIRDADLFREITSPDAFLHEEPSYVTWTPQVHQAPPKK